MTSLREVMSGISSKHTKRRIADFNSAAYDGGCFGLVRAPALLLIEVVDQINPALRQFLTNNIRVVTLKNLADDFHDRVVGVIHQGQQPQGEIVPMVSTRIVSSRPHVLTDLIARRAEIAGEIESHRRQGQSRQEGT